jgi:glycosyltransferase involved in cell wall biosynthesis
MIYKLNIGDLKMICIYSPSSNIWGGGQIYIENLCRYMNEHGLPTVISTSEPETFSCPTIPMPAVSSKIKRLSTSFNLARSLKNRGIKIIVLNDLSSLWLAPIFRLYGLKVVSLLHIYLQKRNSAGLGHGTIEYYLLKFSSFFCNKIFTVNKENMSVFPKNMEFVGNFISPWFFSSPIQPKKYDIAIISRLSREKNIPLFIKLVAQLNTISSKPIKALILGKGSERETIQKEIEALNLQDNIELRDWADRKDLPAIYDSIKCFAITSHHEGFATTLLEAHARGVPAITTKSAGYCAEFLENLGGVTGLSFIPDDVEDTEFQKKVLVLIDNAQDYHDACISKAKLFSEEKVLGKISTDIGSLLKQTKW